MNEYKQYVEIIYIRDESSSEPSEYEEIIPTNIPTKLNINYFPEKKNISNSNYILIISLSSLLSFIFIFIFILYKKKYLIHKFKNDESEDNNFGINMENIID